MRVASEEMSDDDGEMSDGSDGSSIKLTSLSYYLCLLCSVHISYSICYTVVEACTCRGS